MPLANDILQRTILVTGALGAVGRHVVAELLARGARHIVALARDVPAAERWFRGEARVEILPGDVAEGEELAGRLPTIAGAVLLATSWEDGAVSWRTNVDGQVALAVALRKRACERHIWFGTASILDASGGELEAADRLGTPYIASKAEARRRLRAALGDALTIVHPTLVVAGGACGRMSHVARLVHALERHAWLIRLVSLEGSLHLVHAQDLARLTCQLLQCSDWRLVPREIIAGAPAISVREALDLLLERVARVRQSELVLTPRQIDLLVTLFGIRLSPWDRHCLALRHFTYADARLSINDQEPPCHPSARAILRALPR